MSDAIPTPDPRVRRRRRRWWATVRVVGLVNLFVATLTLMAWLFAMVISDGGAGTDGGGDRSTWWLSGAAVLTVTVWLAWAITRTYQRRRDGPAMLVGYGLVVAGVFTPAMIDVVNPDMTVGFAVLIAAIWGTAVALVPTGVTVLVLTRAL